VPGCFTFVIPMALNISKSRKRVKLGGYSKAVEKHMSNATAVPLPISTHLKPVNCWDHQHFPCRSERMEMQKQSRIGPLFLEHRRSLQSVLRYRNTFCISHKVLYFKWMNAFPDQRGGAKRPWKMVAATTSASRPEN
jgi:hypothetical protein